LELYNLKFSDNIRFSVTDIEDYNIKGSFDPNAASDIEFYGYRETTFTVSSVEIRLNYNLWVEDVTQLKEEFLTAHDDQITLIVQNAIDDKQGEL
jgi:hypothetical protein